eukprot:1249145-Amorphochlora_amoeboformis.AAC.1
MMANGRHLVRIFKTPIMNYSGAKMGCTDTLNACGSVHKGWINLSNLVVSKRCDHEVFRGVAEDGPNAAPGPIPLASTYQGRTYKGRRPYAGPKIK